MITDYLARWDETEYSQRYLRSDHWIRVRNLRRDMAIWRGSRFVCEWCGTFQPKVITPRHALDDRRSNCHVHHLTYENVAHEGFGDLVVVCSECHSHLHRFIDQMAAKGHEKKYVMRRLKPYCIRRMLKIYKCHGHTP